MGICDRIISGINGLGVRLRNININENIIIIIFFKIKIFYIFLKITNISFKHLLYLFILNDKYFNYT
jgi:hypothetical protein